MRKWLGIALVIVAIAGIAVRYAPDVEAQTPVIHVPESRTYDGTQFDRYVDDDIYTSTDFTVAGFVTLDQCSSDESDVLTKWGDTSQDIIVGYAKNTCEYYVAIGNSSCNDDVIAHVFTGETQPLGQETHYAVTLQGNTITVYRDGFVPMQNGSPTGIQTFSGDICNDSSVDIGVGARMRSNPDEFLDGTIRDLRFYTEALSAAEIANLAGGGGPPPTPTPTPTPTPGPPVLSFTDTGLLGSGGGGHGACWGDVNGDGWPDLFITNMLNTGDFSNELWVNNQDGTFTEAAAVWGVENPAGGSHGCSWADFNGDGKDDLVEGVTAGPGGGLSNPAGNIVYENTGNLSTGHTLPGAIPTRGITTINLDGDGPDVFGLAGFQTYELELSLNLGNFAFSATSTPAVNASQGVADVDWDGDGDIDIVGACTNCPMLLLRNDNGVLVSVDPSTVGITHQADDGVSAADVNNDARMDLLLCTAATDSCELYLNNGGSFSHAQSFPDHPSDPGSDGYMGAFGDLTNNGCQDLALSPGVYLGDCVGGFSFELNLPVSGINDPRAVSLADYDFDCDLDIVITAKGSADRLLRNDFDSGSCYTVDVPVGTHVYVYENQLGAHLHAMLYHHGAQGYLGQDYQPHIGANCPCDVLLVYPDGTSEVRRGVQ